MPDLGVMHMRQNQTVEIPPGVDLELRRDRDTQLKLAGLETWLQDGQRFPL